VNQLVVKTVTKGTFAISATSLSDEIWKPGQVLDFTWNYGAARNRRDRFFQIFKSLITTYCLS